ncbi:S-(hydroxymethyl)mycothiol dehydrogenase [Pseudoruegeria aquimaris]|uniref:S-(Hydroxymethyl)mycothiol dehydrogenase n=1 Tax=Pseudoruegeria aquimaris TaxID=393663 RepID=A0A1Y5T0V7_9RHOB|nr:zinc-binding dehydrogenase [Pseudoruegeria aquimaris]SLN49471.1 S-(hydroxymethyl)mycothiol dehydrogenase [Pseudoruegeria aquimaris]
MQKIRAAVCHTHGEPLRIEEVSLRACLPGEVEVTVEACAICHSDISYMDGGWGGALPAVYGHEATGRVTAIGEGRSRYRLGDRVLVTLIRACGHCSPCGAGHPVACEGDRSAPPTLTLGDGTAVEAAMFCGAFAEKVVVQENQLAPLPGDIAPEPASLLACGVITGAGAAVNTAQVRPGQTVVVIGAGGVGLNAIQGAHIAGAAQIIAIDMLPEKLEAAREFGATGGILATEADQPGALKALTGGRLADAVFVTVGAIPAYEAAPALLAANGQLVMVGMPHNGDTARYDPATFAALGQGMIGSKMGDVVLARDIPWMIDLYRQGRLKLDELVSARWPLEKINEAVQDTRKGAARRNVIVF